MEFCRRIANQLMLQKIYQKGFSKNIVSSPLSINVVLNMLVAGSKGSTLKCMLGFLRSKNIDEIHSKSRKMMEMAANGGDGPILNMVNGAWVDQRFPLVPKYKTEVLKGIFKCEANNVDFRTKADKVVNEINSWANTASRGLIPTILESVSPETVLTLANGIYFKGIWHSDYEFVARWTTERKFYLPDGTSVLVPFMTSRNDYYYGSFDGCKVLKIPYQSGGPNRFAMYFFLPDERDGLRNLLAKFDSDYGFLNQENFKSGYMGQRRLYYDIQKEERFIRDMQILKHARALNKYNKKNIEHVSYNSPPHLLNLRNSDEKTAKEVFEIEHSEIREKAEKAVKDMNNGLMLIVALIGTVNYAALFTPPGGYRQNEADPYKYGLLVFLTDDMRMYYLHIFCGLLAAFVAFATMFSIQSCPFRSNDFYLDLPLRLLVAMGSLMLSVVFIALASRQVYILERLGFPLGEYITYACLLAATFIVGSLDGSFLLLYYLSFLLKLELLP
ncbi:hypothetical protein RHSIM_Rhsim06G0043300 [Rhododendron simsii]|uniref:Serpin domain-containing protein n=1 Tax=Rhododendron simsii TaxID=118357 RepID=A0A834LJB8_RHOSS|nr:hypothetical protein RHSIM_Rhsim06G0043300 [Rhododendron simsii]